MKTKKIVAVLLTCIVTIGLMAGCGASNTNQSASNNDSQSTSTNQSGNEEADTNSENTTDTTENTSTGNGKTLVVYYSASGNTKDVAEKIAKITEADLFEIEPVEPYTDDDLDWTDDDSRVSREHDDESLRDVELVSTTVDNWDSYDTVYIGYPIWWGIAAFLYCKSIGKRDKVSDCRRDQYHAGSHHAEPDLEFSAGRSKKAGNRVDRGIS